ncbi:MAG: ABC transporter permease [Clostridia bacterium]
MDNFINIFNAAVLAGAPLLLGTLGEILTEKSGHLNLGVEGMMYMGAAMGLAGAYYYEQLMLAAGSVVSGPIAALLSLLAAFIAGGFGALIYSFLTVTLRADQNVTGLTLTIFGAGFGNFFGELMGLGAQGGYAAVGDNVKAAFGSVNVPMISEIPYVGRLLFQYNWMVYFTIILAVIMAWFLNRTRVGLNLRAVGESPATADAAGINVARYKYIATVVGGGICGVGGMYISMINMRGVWVHNCVGGWGWIAVALVIFATWSPARGLICAAIFGGLSILRLYVSIPGLPTQIYDMLPYVATILVLIITSIRQSKEHAQPKSCGTNYFREER